MDEEQALKYCDEIGEENSYGLIEYSKFRQFVINMDSMWHATAARKRSPTYSEASHRSRNHSLATSEAMRKNSITTSEPNLRKNSVASDGLMRKPSIATSDIDVRKNSKDNQRKNSVAATSDTNLRNSSIAPKEGNLRKNSVASLSDQNLRKISTVTEPVF